MKAHVCHFTMILSIFHRVLVTLSKQEIKHLIHGEIYRL